MRPYLLPGAARQGTLELQHGPADLVTERGVTLLVVDDLLAAEETASAGGGGSGSVVVRHDEVCCLVFVALVYVGRYVKMTCSL